MAEHHATRITGPVMLSAAAFVVIVAGLRAAQPIVVPLVVAMFLAMLCLPLLNWLQEKRLPAWLALLVIIAMITIVALVIVAVVGSSATQLREQLPVYQERVAKLQEDAITWLKQHDVDVSHGFERESFNAQRALSLFGNLLGALGSVVSDALVIVFTLIFILLEAADFPAKVRAISGDNGALGERLAAIQSSVRRYVSLKTRLSLLTGVLVTVWLWILGVDFPLLWGLLAFLFNYIPNIGSFIAALPAVVLAFLQLGLGPCLSAAAGYLVINLVIGSILEPRLMGRGLGLSALVVFVSLIFWGWVLGPIGMLFSVPLTMIAKIVMDNSEDLKWLAILLSSEAPPPAGAAKAPAGKRKK